MSEEPPIVSPEKKSGKAKKVLAVLLFFVISIPLGVRLRYGGGDYYPDLSTAPIIPESKLEVVVTTEEPVGNVAVSKTGRLFFTVHPESRPEGNKLYEWVKGKAVPYPDADSQAKLFETPLGVVVDRQQRLWIIDHGNNGFGTPRMIAIDLKTNTVVVDHKFKKSVAPVGSFLQDLQVSPDGQHVYIADVSFWRKSPALLVFDMASSTTRRLLEKHPSVYPQDWIIRTDIKEMVFFGGLAAMKPGIDGIALGPDGKYLYYAAMTHDSLYRIATEHVLNKALTPEQLADHVVKVGKKPLNDGLSIDKESNVLITDVEHHAVMRMQPNGKLETLIKSPKIRWADGLCYGPDGWLYVADSAIPELVLQSKAHIKTKGPWHIFRFKPGIDGIPGQ